MKTLIVAVGRLKGGPERALFDDYVHRLREPPDVIEVEDKRKADAATRVQREGGMLLAKVPPGAVVVTLDGTGRALSSEDLATRLTDWRERAIPAVAFVIGGADGLAAAVMEKADLVLSLGPMTWPHMLVRAMLAEQLYRAEAIAANHPYHRAGLPPGRG